MKRIFLAFALLLAVPALVAVRVTAQEAPADKQPPSKHVRLLTIGNSFSRNATRFLEDIVTAGGHRLTHRPVSVGGASLQLHADKAMAHERDPQDAAGLYSGNRSLQKELQADNWDYVTIQQVSIKSHNIDTYHPFAGQLAEVIGRYAPGAELLVHQTWAYRQDDPRFAKPASDPGEPATQAAMYEGLSAAYQALAKELGVRRLPVGDAFYLADTDSKYGYRTDTSFDFSTAKHPSLPDQSHSLHVGWRWHKPESGQWSLHMDGHHANAAGEYLGACVWYEVLFQESCVGNAFVPAGIDAEYAKFLQQTAHRAVVAAGQSAPAEPQPLGFDDPHPQRYRLQARASELDPGTHEYPEIGFVFGSSEKPLDLQRASVDTRVAPQGKLVIWLMGHNEELFSRLNRYGLHAIQVSYANKWFSILCQPQPKDAQARGNVRLEAATGQDFSDELKLQPADGMMQRSLHFVRWLAEENPQGRWEQFLQPGGRGLRWDKVIISGASHGSTTAARFAQYQRVDRVVMLCGPRDQDQDWQANPSATPAQRFFGFSHVLDGGWTGDHYCRSWELLDMHKHGPLVNIDQTPAPFANSRRLITAADVQNDAGRAHSSVMPGRVSPKKATGEYLFEPVWEYLYTHPVDITGEATAEDSSCRRVHVKY
ncbi:MAG: DUF4886 domain-containing protein [Planctomycetales bacterium]|nr:DUF4886 domain-containing protein [Planctomycetales bacterium]